MSPTETRLPGLCRLFAHRPPVLPQALEPDPLAPWEEHEELRAEADARAADDARRHAEDLLDRPLPFADQAVAHAATRLERLEACRVERCAGLQRKIDAGARRLTHLVEALEAAGAVLEARGVPCAQHAAPLRHDRWWRALIRSAAVAFGAQSAVTEEAWRRYATLRDQVLSARILDEEHRSSYDQTERVAGAVSRAERNLAQELVDRYRAALVAHMPPEALADGVGVAEHTVSVPLSPQAAG